MATTAQWFAQAGGNLIARHWVPTDMKVALMKPTYVPDIDAQMRYTDIVAEEVAAGGGYTTGGKSVTGKSISYDAAANEYYLIGADVSWGPGATFQNGTFLLDWATNMLGIQAAPPV